MLPPFYKGYEMLERNDAKVSRSVLRRERASNRSYLVDQKIHSQGCEIRTTRSLVFRVQKKQSALLICGFAGERGNHLIPIADNNDWH